VAATTATWASYYDTHWRLSIKDLTVGRPNSSEALAQLGRLQLQPLLRGERLGHVAAHLLQRLQLPLVGQVERLGRILGPVEEGVQLLLDRRSAAGTRACT